MVQLPPSHAYLENRLILGEGLAENYLLTDGAVLTGVYLVEQEWSTHSLWLYPPAFVRAIRRVRVELICTGPSGKEHAAACTLEAFLTPTKNQPATSNFEERLQQEKPSRQDRGSWVMVRVERAGDGWKANFDEVLALWILPCSCRVVDHRGWAQEEVEEVEIDPLVASNEGGGQGGG